MLITSCRRHEPTSRMTRYISLGIICTLIFLLIPWQVAFLGCWLYHLYTCAAPLFVEQPITTAVPLINRHPSEETDLNDSPVEQRIIPSPQDLCHIHEREHLLLLMTWLLPFAAPVLAVWVRTLYTAGLTTPFDGDHNFLNVIPYLVLVDSSRGSSQLRVIVNQKPV